MTRSDPGMSIGELIRLATPVGQVLARRLALSLNDLAALHHLVGASALGPAELGKRLGMSSASATVLVDRLEQAGYVRRERDPHDRRRVVLAATETAERHSLAAVRPLVEEITAITDELDEPTRRTIADYLDRVAEAMRAFAARQHSSVAEPGST